MRRHFVCCGMFIIWSAARIQADIGTTSVITLEFPHGAENCGMGEVGVSLADNVNSVFWNPASLPAVGEKQSVQYVYSTFFERLLPQFGIPDLWHADTIHAFFFSNFYKYFDFGMSYSVNFINMGTQTIFDSLNNPIDTPNCTEQVKSFALGLRFADIFSAGFAVKEFDSRLCPGITPHRNSGIAKGQIFDLGFRLEKRFTIADVFDIHPALGFAIHTWPQDSSDYHTGDSLPSRDPLPLKRWFGGSIAINLLDLFGFTYANEGEYAVVGQDFIYHEGYKFQITPFYAVFHGSLIDSAGERFEHPDGHQITFNYQQILRAVIRSVALFNPDLSRRIEQRARAPEKYHLKPNIFFQQSESTIHSSGIRDRQKRKETCFGFSIIGDLNGIPSLKGIFKSTSAKKEVKAPEKKTDNSSRPQDTVKTLSPLKSASRPDSTRVLKDGDLVE